MQKIFAACIYAMLIMIFVPGQARKNFGVKKFSESAGFA